MAIDRILLIQGLILVAGGIPIITPGDEIATLNDYTYRDDPAHERDSCLVYRPHAEWERYERGNNLQTVEG